MKKTIMFCLSGVVSVALAQDMGTAASDSKVNNPEAEKIVAIAEANAKELSTTPVNDFVSAEQVIEKNLEKLSLVTGYSPENGSIIQIGTAEIKVSNPSQNNNFMSIRTAMANQAYLNAKAEIIRSISSKFSAMELAILYDEYGEDKINDEFSKNKELLEAKKVELSQKLEALDIAEGEALAGVTISDRFAAILDGIAKQLDETYNSEDIAESKKVVYADLKNEVASLKEEYKTLEFLLENRPSPMREVKGEIELLSKMPLLGAVILTQSESWDKNTGIYSMAMAVVWSPKLQEEALSIMANEETIAKRKGKYTPQEWVRVQNLSMMVGSRRFIDNKGRNIFVGISAIDLTGKVAQRNVKKKKAALEARKNLAFALTSDMEAYTEASKNFKEYDDDVATAMETFAEKITQKCDIELQGCVELHHVEFTHPISGRPTYVVAYYVDPMLSKNALNLIKKSQEGALRQVRRTQQIRGEIDGGFSAIDEQKQSKDVYNKAFKDAKSSVKEAAVKAEKKAPVSVGAQGSEVKGKINESQGGAFSGDTLIDVDF